MPRWPVRAATCGRTRCPSTRRGRCWGPKTPGRAGRTGQRYPTPTAGRWWRWRRGPPGTGTRPARLAPAFAAVVAEYGARLPFAEAAGLLERAVGPQVHRSPTTVGRY